MTTNRLHPRAIALLHEFEGCRLRAYMPTPQDRPTIGWGLTFYPNGQPVKMGDVITQAQADEYFEVIVGRFADKVRAAIGNVPTTANEFGAMVCLAYNIGTAAFARSSVRRHHRAGNKAAAAKAFGMWNKQAGRVLNGLTRRRAAEAALYLSAA